MQPYAPTALVTMASGRDMCSAVNRSRKSSKTDRRPISTAAAMIRSPARIRSSWPHPVRSTVAVTSMSCRCSDCAVCLGGVCSRSRAVLRQKGVTLKGYDNTTFRLGDELSIRLPSASCVPQVAKEHRWLPVLARQLPLPIPEPVAMGRPGDEFPRPWSVYRWIEGEPASTGQVADLTGFASGLAGFLAALQAIDASDGPPAGAHNFFRGGPLATWDEQTRQLIRLTADDIDAGAAASVWDTALASTWEQAPVWVHGDLTASNVLVAGGALHAVIDFGGVATGDPAYDLVMEWEFFTGDSAAAFRRGLHLDERPGPAAAAGRSGRHSSTSARNTKQATTRKPQPTMTCSDGGTARARLSVSSSPAMPDRPAAEPSIRKRNGSG